MDHNDSKIYDVAVIMSTFNGELYIKEQIESILSQKNVYVDLYIRDDGSKDDTIHIIRDYERLHSNVYVLLGDNLGVGNSFIECLCGVKKKYDYYAFSDQDDIWLEYKLFEAIKVLKKNKKQLYFSNQTCVDMNRNVIGERYEKSPKYGVLDCLSNNMVAGCTFVFNDELYLNLKHHKPSTDLLKCRIHDVWVAEVAALYDASIYDDNSYILYRQHGANVVGAYQNNSFFAKIKRKLKKIKNSDLKNGRSKLALEIVKQYPEFRNNEIIRYASDVKSIRGKIQLLKNYKIFSEYNSIYSFVFYVLFNLY